MHAGLVPEPFASRLIADGRATRARRSPDAGRRRCRRSASSTVNAAVFARADRRPRDREPRRLRPRRARRRATDRDGHASTSSPPGCRSGVTTPPDEFEARLEATRRIYLVGRARDRRPAPRDDRADPGASAAAGHRARAAARGDAAHRAAAPGAHRAGGALTGTPKAASSRAVSSSGSPTTLVKDPSRPATSAPPRPWMA